LEMHAVTALGTLVVAAHRDDVAPVAKNLCHRDRFTLVFPSLCQPSAGWV
jgi:hypothetical protein